MCDELKSLSYELKQRDKWHFSHERIELLELQSKNWRNENHLLFQNDV